MPNRRSPSYSVRFIAGAWLALAIFLTVLAQPAGAHMVPLDDREMVRASADIVVARVADSHVRWNERHTLIVTDYTLVIEDRLKGNAESRIKITVDGGTLDGETHESCLSTPLEVGSRYLLFLSDRHQPTMTPVTGASQGVFREARQKQGPALVTAGSSKVPLDNAGKTIRFEVFVEAMRRWVAEVEAEPATQAPEEHDALGQADLPFKTFDPEARAGSQAVVKPLLAAASGPERPLFEQITNAPAAVVQVLDRRAYDRYVWANPQNRYVVINQLPSNFSVSPHDQYMMGLWNLYGDVFRVYVTPTGTWRFGNGVNDLAGFPPNSQMIQQFGSPWGSGVLGVTYTRRTGGPIIEADIALNPAYSWTLDERAATQGTSGAQSFRQTMLHELGHSWGLKHPWETQNVWWDSVMNYSPRAYRIATLLADDTEAVRTAYPGISLFDVIVSGYATQDSSASNNASYVASVPTPSSVRAGSTFRMTNAYKIENGGTSSIVSPQIEIWLSPTRRSWTGAIYVATLRYSTVTVPRFGTARLSTGTLRVPSTTPAGTYYIGYYVRNSDGNQGNNSAWSDWNGTLRVTR